MKRRVFIALVLLGAAIFVGWKLTSRGHRTASDELRLSGNVDIREVTLGFRVPGRIVAISPEEGDAVLKDDVIARLDPEPLARELEEAQAQVASAEANLKKLRAGYRQQEIDQAKAVLNEREVAFTNARQVFERQQELARTQAISPQERDDSEARFREAEARAKSAKEQLNLLESGFRAEDISAATAELDRAKARLGAAELRVQDTTMRAPDAGVILTRAQEPGAIVQAGTPVLTLSLRNPVWVRTYIHEPDLTRVRPGMAVEVLTDSRPNQPYTGQVGYVSPRAEFTPRNVETVELRTSLVYRTRIVVEDPAAELRQGMPVTVRVPLQSTNRAATVTAP